MLSQSVPQEKTKQSRLSNTPQKRERLDRLNAREDSETIREALTVSASVYLAQFEFAEVRA